MTLYHESVMNNIVDYTNDDPKAKKGFQIYDLGTIIDTKHGKIMLEEYDPKARTYEIKKYSNKNWETVDIKVKEETIYECIENEDWAISSLNESDDGSYTPNDRKKYDELVDTIVSIYTKFINDEDYHLISDFSQMFNNTYHLITDLQELPTESYGKISYIKPELLKSAYETIWDYGFNEKSNLYSGNKKFDYKLAIQIAEASIKILDRSKKQTLFSDDYDLD